MEVLKLTSFGQIRRPKKNKYHKTCFVPSCPNTSRATPEKMFITIPVNPFRRKQWLDAAERENSGNPKTPLFCCQDHFDLEKDMLNYEDYKRNKKVFMVLGKHVVPHIFICKQFKHYDRQARLDILGRLHKENSFSIIKKSNDEEPHKVHTNGVNTSTHNTVKLKLSKNLRLPKSTTVLNFPPIEAEDKPEYFDMKSFEEQFATNMEVDDVICLDSDEDGN